MKVGDWEIYAHPLFLDQLEAFTATVERACAKDPDGYRSGRDAKMLAAVLKLAFEDIPADPAHKRFEQGETLGSGRKHWRRAKFYQQYRLFFRFSSTAKVIVFAWVNDEQTKRAYGSRIDGRATRATRGVRMQDHWRQMRAVAGVVTALCLSLGARMNAESARSPGASAGLCAPAVLPIAGHRIWAHRHGVGRLTVVFESGFGNDSSVWNVVEARVRSSGVQTLVYDRAGMGHSIIDERQPYSLDNDVQILRSVMTRCGVSGPVVFVGHSYGGAIGLVASTRDRRIKGLVLLDAVVPGVWTDHEVDKNLTAMRPQFDQIRKQAPDLAKVAIPWAEGMPRTARQVNALRVPETLPIIEIAAEKGQTDPDSAKTWRTAQEAFVRGHPARALVLAEGSSHKVMVDKPDLVVSSILTMVARVGAGGAAQPAASTTRRGI